MRYFTTTYNNQGTDVKVANYSQAFQEDTELCSVIANIYETSLERQHYDDYIV